MKYFLYILVFSLFLLGCNKIDKPKKPDNLISKDKMVEVLYDVFLLNSAKGVNRQLLENHGIFPEAYIFEKHGIDSLQFALSNNYYAYSPRTYEHIIDELSIKIKNDKKTYEVLAEKEEKIKKAKKDSIKKITDSLKGPKKQRKLRVDLPSIKKKKDSLIKARKLKPAESSKKN